MNLEEIFGFNVPDHNVAIAWLNSYSGIAIRSPDATLVFDPILIAPVDCVQADVIVVTHEHYDHFAPDLLRKVHMKTHAPILTTPYVADKLPGVNVRSLKPGDNIKVKDFEIHATYCEHSANQPLSFMMKVCDEITIYHPSDSKPFAGMENLRSDILLYSGNSLENAARIANLVKPKVALSYYTDEISCQRYFTMLQSASPSTEAKMIKRFEIYKYPS